MAGAAEEAFRLALQTATTAAQAATAALAEIKRSQATGGSPRNWSSRAVLKKTEGCGVTGSSLQPSIS